MQWLCISSARCHPLKPTLWTDWNILDCTAQSQTHALLSSVASGLLHTQTSGTTPWDLEWQTVIETNVKWETNFNSDIKKCLRLICWIIIFFSTQSQWRLWKLGSILSYTGFITIIWLLDCIKSMQTHQCCIWNQYIFTLIALFTKKAVPVNSYAIFNQVSTWATNWHMNDIMVLMIYVIICDHFRACIWGASPLHLDLHSRWFATKEAITQPKLILAIIVILYWLQVHVKAWPWSCTHLNLVRWNYCAFCYRCHNLISLRNCAK